MYGASDGIITTLAIIAGVAGAHLAPHVAIILGFANVVADGFSMGASNYLGLKSELEQRGADVDEEKPLLHGLATTVAFGVAGSLPLLAFVLPWNPLATAGAISALTLLGVGAARTRFTKTSALVGGLEMLLVAGAAGVAAYAVGALTHAWLL